MDKDITIINQNSGYLMIDIANELVKNGFNVNIIAGRLVKRNTDLKEGVVISKIIEYNRSIIILRFVTWLIGFFQIVFLIWSKYRKSSLLIVTNPPIAPLVPLFCRNKFSLLIYDVYIEIIADTRWFPLKYLMQFFWEKAHMYIFSRAENIFTLTEGMKKTLGKYIIAQKIKIVPLWTDNEFFKPVTHKKNPFIEQNNLSNKFIVLYSGNFGLASGVERILEVAFLLNHRADIVFLLIGDGIRKERLLNTSINKNLRNCIFLPWQPAEILPYSLASANLALVTITGASSNHSMPSKLYNYISVGAPILCLADPYSDVSQFVENEQIGKAYDPLKLNDIISFICMLAENPDICNTYKTNSLRTSKLFTKANAQLIVDSLE